MITPEDSPALTGTIVSGNVAELERADHVDQADAEQDRAHASAVLPAGLRVRGTAPIGGRTLPEKAAALAALLRQADVDQAAIEATAAWLQSERRTSTRTQENYLIDLAWWLTYLQARNLTPAAAGPVDADLYAAAMRAAGLADTSRARRLAACSSWYGYLMRIGAVPGNPFHKMERPVIDAEASKTRGLSEDELERLLAHAKKHETARTFALLAVMMATGCRVGGIVNVDLDGYGHDRGHCVLDLPVKGPAGKTKRLVMPPMVREALEDYLDTERGREPGPLFPTRTGKRMDQPAIFRLIRRIAKAAGIAAADDISPHSLRNSVATLLLDKDIPLHVVQDQLGHADPRTTRVYDKKRNSLDRSPAYTLGTLLVAGMTRHLERMGD